jgi:hypothetical protein
MRTLSQTRAELRAWYVARFPALARLAKARTVSEDFTPEDLAWFRSPVREGVRS